ncbi:MAG: PKD domain-containing protein, partial [Pedobacter sp.]
MKKKQLLASALVIMMAFAGCKKAAESMIDCFSESVLVSVHVSVNATNAKQINTEVRYSGSKKVTGVKWEYGDGGTESTTALTGSHTYNSAGNYTI